MPAAEKVVPIATNEFDAPPMPARDRVVQLTSMYNGNVLALTSSGRIWRWMPDAKNFQPNGPHFIWAEIDTSAITR